jgi:hypothetical protein
MRQPGHKPGHPNAKIRRIKMQIKEVALCAHIKDGKVKYYKEYTLNGRVVHTECITCGEFVRLLNPCPVASPGGKEKNKIC